MHKTEMVRRGVTGMTVIIEAHRGDSANAPENTLAAFRAAVALGVQWIELDVHQSCDGQLIVLHDDTVDRTTNGTGIVSEMTTEALRQLDAGAWFAPAFAEERLPLLREVFELVAPTDTRLNIEIKAAPVETNVPRGVVELLRAFGMERRYVVSSFDLSALLAVRDIAPEVTLALIGAGTEILELALHHGLPWIHAWHQTLTREFVDEAHAHHIRVNTWTVDDTATLMNLQAMGIDKLCTNRPAELLAAGGN